MIGCSPKTAHRPQNHHKTPPKRGAEKSGSPLAHPPQVEASRHPSWRIYGITADFVVQAAQHKERYPTQQYNMSAAQLLNPKAESRVRHFFLELPKVRRPLYANLT